MLKNRILLPCSAAIAATVLISWLQIRPFGIIFIILLAIWLYRQRCSSSIKIVAPVEFTSKLETAYKYCEKLHENRPAIFCGILTGFLGTLAVIGHAVSGSTVVLVTLIVLGFVSTKYNFKIIQVDNKEKKTWSDILADDVDDFLPEVNESNLFVLQSACDQAIIPSPLTEDDKFEEVPAELLIPDSIPEIDENSDGSTDDELILKETEQKKAETIEFKSGYFKKDSSISSSSSDDDSLSKGLNFQDYTVVDGRETRRSKKSQLSQSIHAHVNRDNILTNLVSDLVSLSMGNELLSKMSGGQIINKIDDNKTLQHTDSSDESDFEILNTDDLNNS